MARNAGALTYLPTENEWYKAAYYKGGGTSAGYWDYATQSDTAPTGVTADSTGIGSAGSTGNYANYDYNADWNASNGNNLTVGTSGGPSFYGAFDMSGNTGELTDLNGLAGSTRSDRGGGYNSNANYISSNIRYEGAMSAYSGAGYPAVGFRVAAIADSPAAVPEPGQVAASLLLIAGLGGYVVIKRRKAAKPALAPTAA